MDEAWEREANGNAPSFQEFLAAEHLERRRFLKDYMASRGIAPTQRARNALEQFLEHAGNALADRPSHAERVLDALIRVRPECVPLKRTRTRA